MYRFLGLKDDCKKSHNYSKFPNVGMVECRNGKNCKRVLKKVKLVDGRYANMCAFSHIGKAMLEDDDQALKEEETKLNVAKGWELYIKSHIRVESDLFRKDLVDGKWSEYLLDFNY